MSSSAPGRRRAGLAFVVRAAPSWPEASRRSLRTAAPWPADASDGRLRSVQVRRARSAPPSGLRSSSVVQMLRRARGGRVVEDQRGGQPEPGHLRQPVPQLHAVERVEAQLLERPGGVRSPGRRVPEHGRRLRRTRSSSQAVAAPPVHPGSRSARSRRWRLRPVACSAALTPTAAPDRAARAGTSPPAQRARSRTSTGHGVAARRDRAASNSSSACVRRRAAANPHRAHRARSASLSVPAHPALRSPTSPTPARRPAGRAPAGAPRARPGRRWRRRIP